MLQYPGGEVFLREMNLSIFYTGVVNYKMILIIFFMGLRQKTTNKCRWFKIQYVCVTLDVVDLSGLRHAIQLELALKEYVDSMNEEIQLIYVSEICDLFL